MSQKSQEAEDVLVPGSPEENNVTPENFDVEDIEIVTKKEKKRESHIKMDHLSVAIPSDKGDSSNDKHTLRSPTTDATHQHQATPTTTAFAIVVLNFILTYVPFCFVKG